MNCKYCGEPLPAEQTGRRKREYCNNAHRQAHYRECHDLSQPTLQARELAHVQARVTELELEAATLRFDLDAKRYEVETRVGEVDTLISAQADARKQVAELEQTAILLTTTRQQLADSQFQIAELEQTVSKLRNLLDIERRYYEPTIYAFKTWLKKQPQTELGSRILADELIRPRGKRTDYEYHLRLRKYSQEDMQEFTDLWKLMLLSKS